MHSKENRKKKENFRVGNKVIGFIFWTFFKKVYCWERASLTKTALCRSWFLLFSWHLLFVLQIQTKISAAESQDSLKHLKHLRSQPSNLIWHLYKPFLSKMEWVFPISFTLKRAKHVFLLVKNRGLKRTWTYKKISF